MIHRAAPRVEYHSLRFDVGQADEMNLTNYGLDFAVEVYGSDNSALTPEYGKIFIT